MKKLSDEFNLSGSLISLHLSEDNSFGCTVSGNPKLLEFGDKEIKLRTRSGTIRFVGSLLTLSEADKDCFIIGGRIDSVFFNGGI